MPKKEPEKTSIWTVIERSLKFIGIIVSVLLWVGSKWEGNNDRMNVLEKDIAILKVQNNNQDEKIYTLENLYYGKKSN